MKRFLITGCLLLLCTRGVYAHKVIGGAIANPSVVTPPVELSNIYTAQNGIVSKISVSTFTQTATLNPLSPATPNYLSVSVDTAAGMGYYISDDEPAIVAKVNLSTMALVSSLSLGALNVAIGNPGHCSAIDTTYVYFCTTSAGGGANGVELVRIALPTFTVTSTLVVDAAAANPAVTILSGNIYITATPIPSGNAKVYKVSTTSFAVTNTLTTTISPTIRYITVDSSGNGYLSTATSTVAGKVNKISLSGLTEIANLALTSFTVPWASSFDSSGNDILIGDARSGPSLSHVGKIDIPTFTETTVVSTALAGCRRFKNSVIDATNVFFATDSGLICKYLISDLSDVATLTLSGTIIYDMTAY